MEEKEDILNREQEITLQKAEIENKLQTLTKENIDLKMISIYKKMILNLKLQNLSEI